MTISMVAITVDARDAQRVATFWSEALGRPLDQAPQPPSAFFASIGRGDPSSGAPALMFVQVPEERTVKNRVHLDYLCDGDLTAEVERLTGLGATHIHDKEEWGMRWATLADPEGNEFCVATH